MNERKKKKEKKAERKEKKRRDGKTRTEFTFPGWSKIGGSLPLKPDVPFLRDQLRTLSDVGQIDKDRQRQTETDRDR